MAADSISLPREQVAIPQALFPSLDLPLAELRRVHGNAAGRVLRTRRRRPHAFLSVCGTMYEMVPALIEISRRRGGRRSAQIRYVHGQPKYSNTYGTQVLVPVPNYRQVHPSFFNIQLSTLIYWVEPTGTSPWMRCR